MRVNLDKKLAALRVLPRSVLRSLLATSLGGREIALMFHRVRAADPAEINAGMSTREDEIDAAIEFVLEACPPRAERRLTVTLDDGYEDAAAYVETRASRFAGVEFVLFVCPEKAERGSGFRWDLAEIRRQAGESPELVAEILEAPQDGEKENTRDDLREVAADPRFRVAGVERLRALAELPNVFLGNHTNCHFNMSLLSLDQARSEIERSHDAFDRLFGHQRHFAFPFGHGFFHEGHVGLVRARGPSLIWGTGQSPYRPADRRSGGPLTRIGINGPWGGRGVAAVIAGRTLASRVLRPRPGRPDQGRVASPVSGL